MNTVTKNNNAMFIHDCPNCTYHLTLFVNEDSTYYDIYTCGTGEQKQLILRNGNEPQDNLSFPYNSTPPVCKYDYAKLAIELISEGFKILPWTPVVQPITIESEIIKNWPGN